MGNGAGKSGRGPSTSVGLTTHGASFRLPDARIYNAVEKAQIAASRANSSPLSERPDAEKIDPAQIVAGCCGRQRDRVRISTAA